MTPLQSWMTNSGLKDRALAAKVKTVSRVQISRIRRGVSGASRDTALKLEKVTGIPWHEFVTGGTQ